MRALVLAMVLTCLPASARSAPFYWGRLSAQPEKFNAFIKRYLGKVVRLDVRFEAEKPFPKKTDVFEPYGYKGNPSAPEFDVLDRKYVLLGVPQGRSWQSILPYNAKTRRLRGLYRISTDRSTGRGERFNLTFLRI